MISIKSGVEGASVLGVKPEILLAVIIANQVYTSYGYDLVITEITGGKHGDYSRHYLGLAVDLRTSMIHDSNRTNLLSDLTVALGDEYKVIDEGTHFHISYKPKQLNGR